MTLLTIFCAAVGAGLILWRWRHLRGTTLIAPAVWSLLAFASLPLAAWVTDGGGNGRLLASADGIRLMVAMATFCPGMAVLGAKRPQDAAWQLIVATMWVVLSLPGMRAALLADGSPAILHAAPSWLLLVLWGVSAINYLPTRYAVPSLLVAVGQLVLTVDSLPLAAFWPDVPWLQHHAVPVATALFMLATLMVCLSRPGRHAPSRPLDRLWIDFRNALGAVWGLRCQQRINQSAEMYGWPVRLEWNGFTASDADALDPALERAIRNNFANLLRRFVSPAWIARRWEQ